ncbi:hypothetical protein L209DRAFT_742592 [Thermothelomyces heterothallicus CBS 203.75]
MAAFNLPKSSYSLYKPLGDGLFLVRRTTDGEVLLARPLGPFPGDDGDDGETTALLSVVNLLNHENLISIHDELVNIPVHFPSEKGGNVLPATTTGTMTTTTTTTTTSATGPRRMLLWDYPDAGTLRDVLGDYAPRDGNHGSGSGDGDGSMPESFVWHVALGLLRALQWLHEGIRETYGVVAAAAADSPVDDGGGGGGGRKRRWRRVRSRKEAEKDWMPVLHRDLRADNVFLQHPRGIETYGAVKLGNFGRCFVSGSVSASRETPVAAMEEEEYSAGLGALRERKARWDRYGTDVPKSQRPYTRGSELFAVGALLYRMMSGRELPPAEECPDCGCFHITGDDAAEYNPCEHACVKDVNVDSVLQALSNYTRGLKGVVMLLLRLNRNDEWSASNVLDMAWPAYEEWAANTEDGRIYRDIFDDLRFRRQNQIRLKNRRRRADEEEEADEAEME